MLLSIIRFMSDLIPGSREEAQRYLREVEKDMFDEYSPRERRQMERSDRDNYNKNIRPAYWWAGSKTWIDYDEKERDY
jgi:hypothetical protein